MSRLDQLPPDQRAALSVLLRGQKRYGEVASLLGIGERAIHDRAHAALAVLAPREARALDPAQRELIGDYLLGQQDGDGERERTQALLAGSAAAGEWARAVAAELAPEAPAGLPEIPVPAAALPDAAAPQPDAVATGPAAPPAAAASRLGGPSSSRAGGPPSSRLGGALLLVAIVAAIVVAVVLLTKGGSEGKHATGGGGAAAVSSTGATGTSGTGGSGSGTTGTGSGSTGTGTGATGTGTSAGKAHVLAAFALKSPNPGSNSKGNVRVLAEGSTRAFFIEAERIPASKGFFYAIWLYNSPTSALALSKAPAVGASHKLSGAALLPSTASQYHEILLTRETSTKPTQPGTIVLRGRFSVSG